MPQVGLEGQERIAAATVVVAGDDLATEVCARSLAAAGVGRLRLVRRGPPPPAPVLAAMRASNPELALEFVAWPASSSPGEAWLAALAGAGVVVRSGFDDDPMLRAAVRVGVPAIVVRATAEGADVLSFRRHGPCPHLALDLPEQPAAVAPHDGPAAVVAAEVAAAEALCLVAGATVGAARARHVRLSLSVATGGAPPARATDLPWTPECFNCGGTAAEMSFS